MRPQGVPRLEARDPPVSGIGESTRVKPRSSNAMGINRKSSRTQAQRVVRWVTLAAVAVLPPALWLVQRPPTLPASYSELELPVTGLH